MVVRLNWARCFNMRLNPLLVSSARQTFDYDVIIDAYLVALIANSHKENALLTPTQRGFEG